MVKKFSIEELEEVVSPSSLIDVLEVLVTNGYIIAYDFNYLVTPGEVSLEIPKYVEVAELIRELSEIQTSGKVKKSN